MAAFPRTVFSISRLRALWRDRRGFHGVMVLLTRNWGTRVVALLIALCCWASVQLWSKTTVTLTSPFVFEKGEDYQAQALTTNGAPLQSITLKVVCSRRDRDALRQGDYKTFIDLTKEGVSTHSSYEVKSGEHVKYKGPSDRKGRYRIESIKPERIRLVIEKSVYKNVPVQASLVGKPAEGYQVSKTTVKPVAVMVKGPARVLEELAVIPTEPISIDGLSKPLRKDARLEPVDPSIDVGHAKVEVTVGINTVPEQRAFPGIKVRTLDLPGRDVDVTLKPPAVTVVLEARKQFIDSTVPNDVKAYVDIQGTPTGYDLPVRVLPPANCNVISVMPSTVTVNAGAFPEE